jgi:hypothetical protein
MAVDWVQTATWGPLDNPGDLQNHYFRIPIGGAPHIIASAYLNVLSIGIKDGVPGTALAGFKRFEFLDDNGVVQETEQTAITSWIEVQRCVSITIAFDVRAAFANAGWTIYWVS